MKKNEVVDSLFALAQESRLEVFRLLVKRGPEGYTPGELAKRLSMPGATLSFHLKGLCASKLVVARRAGRFLHYSADFSRMRSLIEFLTDQCCSLSDVECSATCTPASTSTRRETKKAS